MTRSRDPEEADSIPITVTRAPVDCAAFSYFLIISVTVGLRYAVEDSVRSVLGFYHRLEGMLTSIGTVRSTGSTDVVAAARSAEHPVHQGQAADFNIFGGRVRSLMSRREGHEWNGTENGLCRLKRTHQVGDA